MKAEIKQRIEQIRRGEVPEGYKKTKAGIAPEEWTHERLDKYLLPYRELSEYNNQYPVLTSSRKGIFLQSDYYNKEVASKDNAGYNVVPRGYFTYRHMSDDEIFKFNINNIVDKGIVSTLYPVFTTQNINHYFLQVLLNEGRDFRRFAILQKQGGSRTYMYFDKLKQLKVCLPPLTEQEKIAEILSTQDKLITLKEKLIEEKKRQKKYLMQQLLTGKQRLPGFSRKWVKQKMSDILRERKEENKDQSLRICSVAVNIGVVDQVEHLGKSMSATDTSNYNVVHYGDIVYTKSPTGKFPYGIIKQSQLKETVAVSPLYGVYVPKNYEMGYLLNEYFSYYNNANGYLLPIVNKGAKNTINISNSTFITPSLYMPRNYNEIKKLTQIFKEANREIYFMQKDLDQEKQKKKALMQLLLTGIVRVNI